MPCPRARLRWLLLTCLLLAGCAGTPPGPPPAGAGSVAVAGVPFFPQSEYQCGPAALATLLWHSGVPVDPDGIRDAVYLPGRRGSLQPELLAASRRHGRVPFPVPGTGEALLAELAAGEPVLVMQNLGIDALPRWHYAVVAGYDAGSEQWLLRSGVEARQRESHRQFMRRWNKAGRWAVVVAPPGRIPPTASPASTLKALAAAEPVLGPAATLPGWDAALARWPEDGDLLFAGANARRASGDEAGAAALYRRLLALDPDHLAGRNNYADLLLQAGCPERAESVLAPALARADAGGQLASVLRATAGEISAAQPGHPPDRACSLPGR